MSKIVALSVTALLLSLALFNVEARPEPTFNDVTPMETFRGDNEVPTVDVDKESCDGLREDECMMRRTLEAHLDYIYTQKQKQP